MPPADPSPITAEQLRALVRRVGTLDREAQRSAAAGHWTAAVILLAAGTEAVLLATVCVCAPELHAAGHWDPRKDDPTTWTLGDLLRVARAAGWLPAALPDAPRAELWATLGGELGDAVVFLERVRNMATHAGAWIRGPGDAQLPLEHPDAMKLTYELLRGIADLVRTVSHGRLNALE